MGILTSFSKIIALFILNTALTQLLHHNDIMSGKVNTTAPWSHRGHLKHNLEPDQCHKGLHLFVYMLFAKRVVIQVPFLYHVYMIPPLG